jgi:hypothetical protein
LTRSTPSRPAPPVVSPVATAEWHRMLQAFTTTTDRAPDAVSQGSAGRRTQRRRSLPSPPQASDGGGVGVDASQSIAVAHMRTWDSAASSSRNLGGEYESFSSSSSAPATPFEVDALVAACAVAPSTPPSRTLPFGSCGSGVPSTEPRAPPSRQHPLPATAAAAAHEDVFFTAAGLMSAIQGMGKPLVPGAGDQGAVGGRPKLKRSDPAAMTRLGRVAQTKRSEGPIALCTPSKPARQGSRTSRGSNVNDAAVARKQKPNQISCDTRL